jgi:hypothetical protein
VVRPGAEHVVDLAHVHRARVLELLDSHKYNTR